MQVAVAVAHEAVVEALPQRGLVLPEFAFGPVPQETILVIREHLAKVVEVLPEIMNGPADEASPFARVRTVCRSMAGGDVLPEFLHVGDGQKARLKLAVEAQVLVEAQHFHGVLERFAVAADDGFVCRSRDGNDLQVQLRRPWTVQPHFFFTVMPAFFQRAEVEEVEYDRLLDLVSVVARKDYPGDVRFEEFDIAGGMRECVFP